MKITYKKTIRCFLKHLKEYPLVKKPGQTKSDGKIHLASDEELLQDIDDGLFIPVHRDCIEAIIEQYNSI